MNLNTLEKLANIEDARLTVEQKHMTAYNIAKGFEANAYDPDEQYDLQQEPHKRNMYETFYIKSLEGDKYMLVWVETSCDQGWLEGEIELLPLTRKVTQVMTEKVEYV